jgi:hypothetical protein
VEYALAGREPSAALALFRRALRYRKSYCGHASSDLDFAGNLAAFLSRHPPSPGFAAVAAAVGRVRQAYRDLDWLPLLSPGAAPREEQRVARIAAAEAAAVQAALGEPEPLAWTIFNDNRHEQHGNTWAAPALAPRHVPGSRASWFRPATEPAPATGAPPAPAGADPEAASATERLLASTRRAIEQCRAEGRPELALGAEKFADYFRALGAGKPVPAPAGADAGSVLCAILADSHGGRPLSAIAKVDRAFAELCGFLAELTLPVSPELGDALEALAAFALREIDRVRSMEVAARLLACKSPTEAVARHRADLSPKVVETLRTAAKSAKAKGNSAYSDRLHTYAAAVQGELAAVEAN